MLTDLEKVKRMFELQNSFNERISGKEWKEQNTPFCTPIWLECAEMYEHLNWKWWADKPKDKQKLQDDLFIELIDILHFGISVLILDGINWSYNSEIKFLDDYEYVKNYRGKFNSIEVCIEEIAKDALDKCFNIVRFAKLTFLLGYTLDDLYNGYVGKNILNRFRQDNGYYEGTYKKIWNNKEDNDWLMDIIRHIEVNENYDEEVYIQLKILYHKHCSD